jgi:hypothetical protein
MRQGRADGVLFQFQHSKSDWQIKARSFLSDVGRCKVDGNPLSVRPTQMTEVTRSLLSLTAVSGSPTTAILSGLPQPAWTSIFDLHLVDCEKLKVCKEYFFSPISADLASPKIRSDSVGAREPAGPSLHRQS